MGSSRGFTLIELALVIAVMGALTVPLINLLQQQRTASMQQGNATALQAAKEALLAYAAQHKGCLPHAADFEGGIADTDVAGLGNSYNDTGSVRQAVEPAAGNSGQRAGDIPWADLRLTNMGRDADNYRIQYYVSSAYTSPTQTRAGNDNAATRDDCLARLRTGVEAWDATARYAIGDIVIANGLYYVAIAAPVSGSQPPNASWAVFGNGGQIATWNNTTSYNSGDYANDGNTTYRALLPSTGMLPASSPPYWRAIGLPGQVTYPSWQTHALQGYRRGEIVSYNGRVYRAVAPIAPPAAVPVAGANWQDISLPVLSGGIGKMLETRIGPNVGTAPGNIVASNDNVFVLIAAGRYRNGQIGGRVGMRDANHQTCTGTACANWTTLNDVNVDTRSFSLTRDSAATPVDGDTILPVSFTDYQTYMANAGLKAQAIQW